MADIGNSNSNLNCNEKGNHTSVSCDCTNQDQWPLFEIQISNFKCTKNGNHVGESSYWGYCESSLLSSWSKNDG